VPLALLLAVALVQPAAASADRPGDRGDPPDRASQRGPDQSRRAVLDDLIGHQRHQGRVLWYDLSANVDNLDTPAKVREVVARTAGVGFDTIVLDVGNYTGFVAYDSAIAPHISQAATYAGRTYPEGYDLLAEVLAAADEHGLEVHANLNIFAQGATGAAEGPAYDHPEWQSVFHEGRRLVVAGDTPEADDAPSHPLAGTDSERGADQLVVYTPDTHDVSPANRWGAEVAVSDGVVTDVRDRQSDDSAAMPVPADGFVLSGHGDARTWLLEHAAIGTAIDLSRTETRLVPASEHDPQFATFVNPLRDDVRAYVWSLITELVRDYPVDGIVLDRARYASEYADFSEESRAAFEARIGHEVERWPEDVFEIVFTDTGQDIERGPLFEDWLEFRAAVIQDFVDTTGELVHDLDPDVRYSIYAGAWYPLYWQEGVNWGSREFQPDLDWASDDYGSTGYAEALDFFMAGTYFEDVTRDEAVASGQPEDWYSVEGSAELAMEATDLATFVYGSLFVLQYEADEDRFRRAMEMALERTHGVMVFDLVYLEMYDWWHVVEEVLDGPGASPHTNAGLLRMVRR
jgi:uncharacterized lipoprotein YddW (UPF0748 family)